MTREISRGLAAAAFCLSAFAVVGGAADEPDEGKGKVPCQATVTVAVSPSKIEKPKNAVTANLTGSLTYNRAACKVKEVGYQIQDSAGLNNKVGKIAVGKTGALASTNFSILGMKEKADRTITITVTAADKKGAMGSGTATITAEREKEKDEDKGNGKK